MIYNVILSGGVGSRLWPLSRKSTPKQYLPLFENQSLFQLTLLRNQFIANSTIIVGNKDNYLLSDADIKKIGVQKYSQIIEAAPRNTAAAIAFACFDVQYDDILVVTPADHIITNQNKYESVIAKGIALAKENFLITFGIKPTKPETGYGYIEHVGESVISFREKPNEITAKLFIDSKVFLWNSGMFCFKAGIYLKELEKHAPELYNAAYLSWINKEGKFLPLKETLEIPSISVDYAVMEKSNIIKVVEADFDWSDLGSFDSIWDYLDDGKDKIDRQVNLGLITKRKHIEFLDVANIIVVETNDAILVMPRNHSQGVKNIYERLERENPTLIN